MCILTISTSRIITGMTGRMVIHVTISIITGLISHITIIMTPAQTWGIITTAATMWDILNDSNQALSLMMQGKLLVYQVISFTARNFTTSRPVFLGFSFGCAAASHSSLDYNVRWLSLCPFTYIARQIAITWQSYSTVPCARRKMIAIAKVSGSYHCIVSRAKILAYHLISRVLGLHRCCNVSIATLELHLAALNCT